MINNEQKSYIFFGQPFYKKKEYFIEAFPNSDKLFRVAKDCHKVGAKHYTAFESPEHYLKFIEKIPQQERHFYEIGSVEGNQPERFKLDFDFNVNEKETKSQHFHNYLSEYGHHILEMAIKNTFRKLFKELNMENHNITKNNISILSATTNQKVSLHIIIHGYAFRNCKHAKEMRNRVYDSAYQIFNSPTQEREFIKYLDGAIDKAPYNKFQSFRIVGCSKMGKDNVLKPISATSFHNCLFTHIRQDEIILEVPFSCPTPYKGDSEPMKITPNTMKALTELLANVAISRAEDYNDWMRVCFALKNQSDSEEMAILFDDFSQRGSNYSKDAVDYMWNHTKKKEKGGIGIGTLLKWLKDDCNDKKLYKDIKYTITPPKERFQLFINKYVNAVAPKMHLENCSYSERFVREFPLGDICIQSYLGTGKTTQIEKVVNTLPKNARILILSPRIKFAKSISSRLAIPCYLDVKYLSFAERIVISVESLHKLFIDEFDLIILDEVESIFTQLFSPTVVDKEATIHTFENVMKNAHRIIAADAFVSDRTIQCLKIFRKEINIIQNIYNNNERKAIKTSSPQALENQALEFLEKGKKIFYVFSHKKALKSFEERLPESIKYRSYHSSADDNNQDFLNVNETWKKFDIILTTSVITVGINFDVEHFDYIFLQATNCGPIVRDLFQSVMRIRHINSNELWYNVDISFIFGMRPMTIREIEKSIDEIQEQMKYTPIDIGSNMLIENGLTLNRTKWVELTSVFSIAEDKCSKHFFAELFNHYLTFCGYQTEKCDIENDDMSERNMGNKVISPNSVCVMDISDEKYDVLVHKRNKTVEEKMQVNKKMFMNMFKNDYVPDDTILESIVSGEKRWLDIAKNMKIEKDILNGKTANVLSSDREACFGLDEYTKGRKVLEFMKQAGMENSVYEGRLNLENVYGDDLKSFLQNEMKVRFKGKGDGNSCPEITRNFKTLLSMWNGRDMHIETIQKWKGNKRGKREMEYHLYQDSYIRLIYNNLV